MQVMIGLAAQSKTLTAKTLAAFLCLAVSGAYCLLCCQALSAQSPDDSCPLTKTNHCNSSENKPVKTDAPAAKGVNAFECCGLKFNFFVAKLEKNDRSKQNAAPVAASDFSVMTGFKAFEKSLELSAFQYRPPNFDLRSSRVRNGVFRI